MTGQDKSSVMTSQLPTLLLVLSASYALVGAQIQYYENNTLRVPIWHFFKTTKAAWRNFTLPSTLPELNWIEYHRKASLDLANFYLRSSTTPSTKDPPTPYPLFSFGTDRLFNLSHEAVLLKRQEDLDYEIDTNKSFYTEPEAFTTDLQPSPRIFNLYKGVYVTDPSVEQLFWNKSYYDRYNRSINWEKKKAYWRRTPKKTTTEWYLINVTKIGDWQRAEYDIYDLSYWDSERIREEYSHHDYMEKIKKVNRTPTTEQVTPLIKLLANTRIASLWKLHSILPYLNDKTTLKELDTAEMRDLVYSEQFPVSSVIPLQHMNSNESEYSMKYDYDYRDLSAMFGERALQQDATKLWDSRYYRQNFPPDMTTRHFVFPTSPDPWEEWLRMDTWKRREYILRGWNTARPDMDATRAGSPWYWSAHPSPTVFDYYYYQEYTPLEEIYRDILKETTRISSREVSNIIWSEKQAVATTTQAIETRIADEMTQKRQRKRKIWTTAKPKIVKKRFNRTLSHQELRQAMRLKYKKMAEKKELEKRVEQGHQALEKHLREPEEGEEKKKEKEDDDETFTTKKEVAKKGAGKKGAKTEKAIDFAYLTKATTIDRDDMEMMFKITALPSTKEPLKEFQCHICLKQMSSKGGYQRHINTHKRMGQWLDPF